MNEPTIPELRRELERLSDTLAAASRQGKAVEVARLAQEHRKKCELLAMLERRDQVRHELGGLDELTALNAGELARLAAADRDRLTSELAAIAERIESHLMLRDPRDNRNVILEIRAGAGGEEASLFAMELLRAYTRYAERAHWIVHVVHSSHSEQGGLKEVIAEMKQPAGAPAGAVGPYGRLKYEKGVHRVQRVPTTEKMGRIHTSTATVAVLPEAEDVDVTIRPEDLRIDTYRASGAGGQHVNKTSSAVRITHLPTNTMVAVQDERSQHKNRAKAMAVLRARLFEMAEEKRRAAEASERRAQVGTGDRSEKIRTYNIPQDRVTDHRIKKSWSNIAAVLDGKLEPIFVALRAAERELAQAAQE